MLQSNIYAEFNDKYGASAFPVIDPDMSFKTEFYPWAHKKDPTSEGA